MIKRTKFLEQIEQGFLRAPIVAILGPRQCGKTTLAKQYAEGRKYTYYDMENISDRQALENANFALPLNAGLVIIDEIQLKPELYAALRVLVDEPENQVKYLILGSASPQVLKESSDSLAGRVAFVDLTGFTIFETDNVHFSDLWLRGGFPRSYLALDETQSRAWREEFIRTFLVKDLPLLGLRIDAFSVEKFWRMLSHYSGQTWNAQEMSRSLQVSDKTVRSYLDVLTHTFMIRQLQPWFQNISKRQVKSPKIYFRDSGILHALLDITSHQDLLTHPKVGASWEGFVIEQIVPMIQPSYPFFWATVSGAELDLFWYRSGKNYGVEVKFNEAPSLTPSMRIAVEDLNLEHLWVVTPGKRGYQLAERVSVLPLAEIDQIKM